LSQLSENEPEFPAEIWTISLKLDGERGPKQRRPMAILALHAKPPAIQYGAAKSTAARRLGQKMPESRNQDAARD
jgi:hypothetical protein